MLVEICNPLYPKREIKSSLFELLEDELVKEEAEDKNESDAPIGDAHIRFDAGVTKEHTAPAVVEDSSSWLCPFDLKQTLDSSIKPQFRLDPNKFIINVSPFGPNNQFHGFRDTVQKSFLE